MASEVTGRPSSGPVYIEEPPFSRWLFGSSAAAWIWLVARLWLGYEWLHAGWEKVQSPAWMDGGKALQGFIKGPSPPPRTPSIPRWPTAGGSAS